MGLYEILQWIKTLDTKASHYYCSTLDSKKEKSFGVYQLKSRYGNITSLSGLDATKTAVKGVSILVHWNSNSAATENTAMALYENLRDVKNVTINGKKVNYIQLIQNEPVDVGTDESGIFERVIECNFYYERS